MDEVGCYLLEGLIESVALVGFLLGPLLFFAILFHLLSLWIFQLLGGGKVALWFLWLTAPGTIVHELGHAVFCLPFGHRIERIRLFRPARYGSVGEVIHSHSVANPWAWLGHFFIGTGPLWMGGVVIGALGRWLLNGAWFLPGAGMVENAWRGWPAWWAIAEVVGRLMRGLFQLEPWGRWTTWLFLYLAFSIGVHMSLSGSDVKDTVKGFGVLVLTVWILLLIVRWAYPGVVQWAEQGIRPLADLYAVLGVTACLCGGVGLMLGLGKKLVTRCSTEEDRTS
jgi:hypothetical protein